MRLRKGDRFYLLRHDRPSLVEVVRSSREAVDFAPVMRDRVVASITMVTTIQREYLARMFDYGFAALSPDGIWFPDGETPTVVPTSREELYRFGYYLEGWADANTNGRVRLAKVRCDGRTVYIRAVVKWWEASLMWPETVALYGFGASEA